MNEIYFNELMKMCKKALKKNEVPVAALIIKENKIIAKAYNKRHNKNNILNHAEIMAINKASHKLKDWRLDNCDLYVTLKPCSMCENIIKQSRIKNVYYILDKPDNKKEYYKTIIKQTYVRNQRDYYHQLLKKFFATKRKKIC